MRLGQHTLYVNVDDLVTLGLISDAQRPTIETADIWCQQTLRVGLDLYGKALPLDTLRGIVTRHDPRRQVALVTLIDAAETGREFAALAVKKLRDRNTVARAEGRRAALALTLTAAELLNLGATDAEASGLPTADEGTRAASVKVIESWNDRPHGGAQVHAARRQHRADEGVGGDPAACRLAVDHRGPGPVPLWRSGGDDPAARADHDCRSGAGGEIDAVLVAGRSGDPRPAARPLRGRAARRGDHGQRGLRDQDSPEAGGGGRGPGAGVPALQDHPDGITLPISIRDDLDTLTALLTGIEPGLVIFDPIKDFLGDGVNTDREDEVRPVLTPLLKLTEECGTAVIGLHHLNKSLKGDFLTRLTGSGAFKNVSRSVIGVAHDLSTDRRLVQLMKSNDGELARSAFQARVIGVDITIDGRTEKVGKWVMEGVSLSDLDTVLAAKEQGNRGASAAERAKDALAKYLGGAEKPSDEVKQAVAKQLNLSEETVKRAFREMGKPAHRATPADSSYPPAPSPTNHVETGQYPRDTPPDTAARRIEINPIARTVPARFAGRFGCRTRM